MMMTYQLLQNIKQLKPITVMKFDIVKKLSEKIMMIGRLIIVN